MRPCGRRIFNRRRSTRRWRLLQEHAGQARIVAGGTDLIVELQRGIRPTGDPDRHQRAARPEICARRGRLADPAGRRWRPTTMCSPRRPAGRAALPLAQACLEVGAPQIRTRATIAGNLITASPANDTIAPLMALDAEVVLVSVAGERVVPLRRLLSRLAADGPARRTSCCARSASRRCGATSAASSSSWGCGARRRSRSSTSAIVLTFDGETGARGADRARLPRADHRARAGGRGVPGRQAR